MFKALFANFGYKMIALVVSLALWGVSHSTSNIERGFDVPIVIRGIPEDIVITDQSATEVNVRVMGSRAALRRFSTLDVLYPVEISGAKPGPMTLEIDEAAFDLPRGTRVVSRSPANVQLLLARSASKAVRVRADLEGAPASGYRLGEIVVKPSRVRITGARAEVLRLNEVVTETIDVSGAVSDIVREVRVSLGGQNLWLQEPTPIEVRIPVAAIQPTRPGEGESE